MKRYILTLWAIVIAHTTFAQFATTFIDETELQFKVKQIDEFIMTSLTMGKSLLYRKIPSNTRRIEQKICLLYSILINTWTRTRNPRNLQPI